MITYFRSLQRQVIKATGELGLLSALKLITSSDCYAMEGVLSSPSLPVLLGQYGKDRLWLFLETGYAVTPH